LTLAGVSWIFACAPADDAIARVLVDAVLGANASSAGKVVLLSSTDHESRMTSREVLAEFSRRGRLPELRLDFQPGTVDIAPQMRAMKEARPAAILIVAPAEDAARLVKAAREKAPSALVFGSHAMGRSRFLKLAANAAENVRFPLVCLPMNHWSHAVPPSGGPRTANRLEPDLQTEGGSGSQGAIRESWSLPMTADSDADAAGFTARFRAATGHLPDYTATLTYDATRLLLSAIRRAGPNRARLREALARTASWRGVAGTIHFDGTGQNARTQVCMGTIRDGMVVSLQPQPITHER
jgi:branched-chain amino acid transport system substrate-binding protein